jgi:hypothetical protein
MALKNGHTPSHLVEPMSIAPCHTQKTQFFCYPTGHFILRICDLAIKYLKTIHILEKGPFAGLFDIHLELGDPKEEKPPERMGCNHDPSGCVDFFTEFLNHHHSPNILFISEY